MRTEYVIAVCCCLLPAPAVASVVDATRAEELYQAGDYQEARTEFLQALEEFGAASKDSTDYRSYRELAYLYDRLADCSFTQRDWPALKLYLDGLHEVSSVELNLVEAQLSGALLTGVATATAQYLYDRVDESVRLNSIVQIKRSIGLVLLDSRAEGEVGATAIELYQQLAAAVAGVLELTEGCYALNIARLEQKLEQFDAINSEVERLADLEALWRRYQPDREADGSASPSGD